MLLFFCVVVWSFEKKPSIQPHLSSFGQNGKGKKRGGGSAHMQDGWKDGNAEKGGNKNANNNKKKEQRNRTLQEGRNEKGRMEDGDDNGCDDGGEWKQGRKEFDKGGTHGL
jgi:hypothetical protein